MKYLNLASLLLVSGPLITQARALAIPEDIEARSFTDTPGHGNYGRYEGNVIRYHEIRDGLFTGIEPGEWDDNVHKRHVFQAVPEQRSDGPHKRHDSHMNKRDSVDDFNSYEFESLTGGTSELSGRDILDRCRTQLRCAKEGLQFGGYALYGYGEMFVQKVRELGPNVLDQMNKPLMANFAGVGGQNLLVTGIFTAIEKGSSGSKPEDCSENLSQTELLQALMKQGCASNKERSSFRIQMDYPDGSVFELTMKANPGTLSESDLCQASS